MAKVLDAESLDFSKFLLPTPCIDVFVNDWYWLWKCHLF